MAKEKVLWNVLEQLNPDLVGNGVVLKTLLPKRRDGLYGISLWVPVEDNRITPPVVDILATLEKPDKYIFQVTIFDKDLGAHVNTNDENSPPQAFERAKREIRRSLVSSEAQDEAIRVEEIEYRLLDIAENAAIAERLDKAFVFQIESVEIACHPASWSFEEKK